MKNYTIADIQKLKQEEKSFVTLTAYDYPTAKIINKLNIPLILVGDSASMVVYGYKDTTPICMDEILLITRAVKRGIDTSLIVGDMPFMSYQPSIEEAIKNAGRFIKEGQVDAVKLEGGREYINQVKAIITAGIPVIGHVGLKPQSVLIESGYKIQGKSSDSALNIYKDAIALQDAGVFALVLEGVPSDLAEIITQTLKIPTIGIGAGKNCDGQIQVLHDLIGFFGPEVPKHAKAYLNLQDHLKNSINTYISDVENNIFPNENNFIKMNKNELKDLKIKIENL
ncbi:3-methyl-2-oxobutanoate hydroxymethyltransferase [bacterium]|nr:MAG: 3-methyl-2-oxobutanoate hydroxymethyltransferase [bacterium]|tara:strand:+ start:474 stop:1322 length:849 start_codon:yes stop_codon:yes gene_type:complete